MTRLYLNFFKLLNLHTRRALLRVNHGKLREFIWTILPTIVLVIIAIPSVKLLYLMDAQIFLEDDNILTFKVIGHQWFWTYEYGLFSNFSDSFFNFSQKEFDSYMLDENSVLDMGGLRLLEVDNPLIVPTDCLLRFLITSTDVLHAWAVPSLGIKVDAVPGRLSQVYVKIKRVGVFYGQCSELCGVNHGFMPIKVISVPFYGISH